MMIGSLLLLAASNSVQPLVPDKPSASGFVPSSQVTARARASVRIVAAAKFGSDYSEHSPGADRRNTIITDQHGPVSAILLEFQ